MTAPDMVELGAMALFDDNPVWHLVHDRPALWGEVVDSAKERYRRQARAVLAAISEAGRVEWAIQMPTFIDGDFDRTYAKDALTGKPFTEDAAKNHSWLDSRSPIPTRVVSRITGPWERAE